MIAIEKLEDGWRVTETEKRWTYYVYPDGRVLRNNGPRYQLREGIQAQRLTLPIGWSLGDVIDAIIKTANANAHR